jgi:oligopeptide/dipeptide ABC transporter ATP-binding protein
VPSGGLNHPWLDEFKTAEKTGHRADVARNDGQVQMLADGAREGNDLLGVKVAREVGDREVTTRGNGVHQRINDLVRAFIVLDEVQDAQQQDGYRQRAAIARALAVSPRLLVLDEPTSALDVTAQARVLKLVRRLRAERELAYLFITHNLAIAGELCEQTTVLYLGRVAETGPTSSLLARPAHPYTVALLSSVPELDLDRRRARIILPGGPLHATARPAGCAFHPRCPLAIDVCRVSVPELRPVAPGWQSACHRGEEVLAGLRPAPTARDSKAR